MTEGAKVGIEISQAMVAEYGNNKVHIQNRFRSLINALASTNPQLRLQLINRVIDPKKFVSMQEADLTSDEMKRKNEEVMKYQM
mgnify:CR=1 FL=1